MKTEAEIRQQLTETRAVIAQLETQLNAAANQEWALRFVLGEVDTPHEEASTELDDGKPFAAA